MRDRLKGLPKPPNSGNVALRTTARRCRLCHSGSNVYERRLRGCYGTGSAFQLSAQSERLLDNTLAAALFGTGAQPGVQTIAPPPLAWERRSEWGKVRSQVKGCDALFWIQLAARPNGPIHVASYLNLGARRSNFVLDAWKPSLTKIGLVATVERLDPCFVAYREATEELTRRFPLAKFVWLPFGAATELFLSAQGTEVDLRLLAWPPLRAFASGASSVLRNARPSLRLFQRRRIDHGANRTNWRPTLSTSSLRPLISTIPKRTGGFSPSGDAVF